jgi:hypothetical protein
MDLLKEVFSNFNEVYNERQKSNRRLDSFRPQHNNGLGGRNRTGQESEKIFYASKDTE